MRTTTRLIAVLGAAALITPLITSPAYAAGSHRCYFGDLGARSGDMYDLTANGCDGFGYADVVVTILSGTAEGVHRCGIAFPWNSGLGAWNCVPEGSP